MVKRSALRFVCLTSLNRRSENVVIKPVVIFELAFRDVEWQIFFADFVIAADNRPLEDRPEALNRVRVNRANNVLLGGMINRAMIVVSQAAINTAFIGREQANLVGHAFTNKGFRVDFIYRLQNTGNNVALALYRADDWRFSRGSVFAAGPALVLVLILVFAADESFIDLDNATKLVHVLFDQRGADFVAHAPRGFDRTKTHVAAKLAGTNSLFGGQHQMGNLVPIPQGLVRILENCTRQVRETVARRTAGGAGGALPVVAGSQRIDLRIAAARAMDTLRPAPGDQIGDAIVLGDEHGVKLGTGELVDGFRFAGHIGSPSDGRILPHG